MRRSFQGSGGAGRLCKESATPTWWRAGCQNHVRTETKKNSPARMPASDSARRGGFASQQRWWCCLPRAKAVAVPEASSTAIIGAAGGAVQSPPIEEPAIQFRTCLLIRLQQH